MSTTTDGTRASCTCASCVKCCERKPGWFKPGEAERVAAFLNISLPELFRDYLAVDWWVESEEPYVDTYILSPNVVGHTPGTEFPLHAGGQCVFLTNTDRCGIHAVKPFECAGAWCGNGAVNSNGGLHEQAADAWRTPAAQAQIVALLTRKPESATGTSADVMRMWSWLRVR